MVRRNYNRSLSNKAKLQSSLGRVGEVYKEDSDSLVMARVLKVNYIYNTVDVVTIKYSERLAKDSTSSGKFSAKLPVGFSGQLSNGDTYGQTIPIDVGDQVLVGFIDKDKNSPIVLNIYKNSDTASELAPTDAVSGNPEDSSLVASALESFSLYPSQTYRLVDGLGGVENTYQGKSFFKSTLTGVGNGKLNDYGFSYEQLTRYRLRGRDVYPYYANSPQMLFQHTGDDTDIINNIFLDSNGDLRISSISKSSMERVGLAISGTDFIGFSYQDLDNRYDKESSKSFVGIDKGIPSISYGDHSITFTDKDGIVIDGKPLSDWGGGDFNDDIERIEKELSDLQHRVDKLDTDEVLSELIRLADEVDDTLVPQYAKLIEQIGGFDSRIKGAEDKSDSAYDLANKVAKTISDAAGTDESLLARLDRVDRTVKAMQDVITEVVAARTYNITSHTYSSLGVRLDTLEEMTRSDNQRLSDLIDKLDIFLSEDFSKGVASYVATIQAYGDLVMRNGQGSVTLDARLYKGGFEWTGLLDDGAFVWERHSDDLEGDMAFNANHLDGSKSLTVTGADFGYGATFTVNVTVQGHLIQN